MLKELFARFFLILFILGSSTSVAHENADAAKQRPSKPPNTGDISAEP